VTITYLGGNSFKIKGSSAVVAISDTVVPDSDILVSTQAPNFPNLPNSPQSPFLIDSSGEYEVKGVHIYGYNTQKDNLAFLINIDGFNIVHLGATKKLLDDDLASELSTADILMLSVGGKSTMDTETATEIVSQIEPKIVIPMNFETIDDFTKAMGRVKTDDLDKLSLKSPGDLPEETEVIILKS